MIPQTAFPQNKTLLAMVNRPNRQVNDSRNWHALEASAVAGLLEVDPSRGLTPSEVTSRRAHYGLNSCEALGSRRITGILVLLSLSTVSGFLLTAAILNSAVRTNIEVFSLLLVVAIAAVVSFAYMLKAARARDAMQEATQTTVRVRREGRETNVQAEELVPGDTLILNPGNCVAADARLIKTVQLQVQESALSGKNSAIAKQSLPVATDATLDQRQSMVYLGSTVLSGSALAVVVTTGVQSELGKQATFDRYQ